MRAVLAAVLVWCGTAFAAVADTEADRLFDAMGMPGLIAAFSEDGLQSVAQIDSAFLGGEGGDVLAETGRRLYDPARLEAELRTQFARRIDPQIARQAAVFFESAQGARIVRLEVEARQALVDDQLEEAAKSAADPAPDDVVRLISVRDLVEVNTDIAMAARFAFFDGLLAAAPGAQHPDIEAQRESVAEGTRAWITGYYALVASALEADDMDTYAAFWETDVGRSVDAAVSAAFEHSYVALSYGLGQMVGRLMPQNDL